VGQAIIEELAGKYPRLLYLPSYFILEVRTSLLMPILAHGAASIYGIGILSPLKKASSWGAGLGDNY
jgi:hypothetical protein